MSHTAAQLAEEVRGEVLGDGSTPLTGLAPAAAARAGDLTFAEQESYLATAEQSEASAILVPEGITASAKVLIRVANPRIAMARLLPIFFPPEQFEPGIHPSAEIAATAEVDASAHIGAGCVVRDGANIGPRSVLMAGNHVGLGVTIGEDCCLHPNVVVYQRSEIGNRVTIHAGSAIGSDGYGYVLDEGAHRKILQVGNVIIHDDVEIGANAAIDRGALGSTVIGTGTKIDNLVHIAHNVVIGRHCIITGQVGFGGSTKLGDYVVIAAQSGIADHLTIGNQVTIAAKTGVMRDIPDGGKVFGIPATPHKQAKRQIVATQQLPELIRRTRELEKQLEELKARLPAE